MCNNINETGKTGILKDEIPEGKKEALSKEGVVKNVTLGFL